MIIQISGQYGDPKASAIFWPMQKKLNTCFEHHIRNGYLKTIKKFAIGIRVSGGLCDFKSQGAERLRYLKKNKTLTIDLVFPESQWINADINHLKKVLAEGTISCLELMIEKSMKLDELISGDVLRSDIGKSIAEFLQ